MKIITLLIAEDHLIVRQGLRSLLDTEKDIKIVCETCNGREAVMLAKKHKPSVLLIDIAMPYLNGLEAARQILEEDPSSRILFLSAHSDIAYLDKAIEPGVAGFLLKQTSAITLSKAIRTIAQGKNYFSPSFSKHLTKDKKGRGSALKMLNKKLTSRETEVLQLIAEGMANKQTASEIGISIKTVEKHRQALMDKLDLHDTAGLTRYAIQTGVVESSIQLTFR